MTISAALVLFAIIWFMVLFVILPMQIKTQDEDGKVVRGTPASAPTDPQLKRKVLWVTIVTIVIWIPLCLIISSGIITIDQFNPFF